MSALPHAPGSGHDAQYQRERRRHPDQLATEVITLRRQKRILEQQLADRTTLAFVIPPEYAAALAFAYDLAHSAPVTEQETPGRPHPESAQPGYNAAAFKALHAEQAEMRKRTSALRTRLNHAAENPDG